MKWFIVWFNTLFTKCFVLIYPSFETNLIVQKSKQLHLKYCYMDGDVSAVVGFGIGVGIIFLAEAGVAI